MISQNFGCSSLIFTLQWVTLSSIWVRQQTRGRRRTTMSCEQTRRTTRCYVVPPMMMMMMTIIMMNRWWWWWQLSWWINDDDYMVLTRPKMVTYWWWQWPQGGSNTIAMQCIVWRWWQLKEYHVVFRDSFTLSRICFSTKWRICSPSTRSFVFKLPSHSGTCVQKNGCNLKSWDSAGGRT